MREEGGDTSGADFVSTPQGIFTASGTWFSATEETLRAYAGSVLEHVPLGVLIRRADRWLHAPLVVTLWALPALLGLWTPLLAAGAALVLFVGWKALSPAVASRWATAVVGWLGAVWLQGLYYVFTMSVLAGAGRYAATAVGLAGFVLLRWGLVGRVAAPLVRVLARRLYALPLPDQVLRAFIVRAALTHGVPLPELERMERRLFEKWSRGPDA